MGRRRQRGRRLDGILLLDKPQGITSNAALQRAKRLYDAQKAGHTGSLDPLASGMLPVCFGEGTKMSAFLLDADKHYWVRIRLGERTNTADADGEVVETRPVPTLDRVLVESALDRFKGPIEQIPPMYSAVRVDGERLYKLARAGIEVERKARPVTLFALELLALEAEELELQVHCSKGTYVRTLAEDLGEALGCGAHVTALRRTGVGPFRGHPMVTLEQLQELADDQAALDALLIGVDEAIADMPRLDLNADLSFYLRQGQPIFVPKAPTAGLLRLYDPEGRFLGVGEVLEDGRVGPRRLIRGD